MSRVTKKMKLYRRKHKPLERWFWAWVKQRTDWKRLCTGKPHPRMRTTPVGYGD